METYKMAVLTVIAISLAAIALQTSGVLPPAHAFVTAPVGRAICAQTTGNAPWNCAEIVNGALLVRAQ
jgi:hypothetical protein